MSKAPESGFVTFRPRARLLKLIGAELISDEVLAITELVKNAHDADASCVTIEFKGVTGQSGEIVIRDDGHGMDLDTLLGKWMEPAGTSKAGPSGRITARGRRVLGEKGVGRFAADKLARKLELATRCEGDSREIHATLDWDEFESDTRMLSEIRSKWQIAPASVLASQGTHLRMTGLRAAWNERMFRRLSTRLARLMSPFRELHGFTIRIESDEFPQYSGEPRADFLERAPYHIEATFDGKESVDVSLNAGKAVRHSWNGSSELECGPVKIRIYGFDLETEAMARIGSRMEVRAWLREWSGISVYRDGFRVWPYGEPHDDWLRLDHRRVNNPVVRLSNNQVVGFIEITRDANPGLVDQTNREGLISSRGLEDLRRLIYFVLQILEAERQSVRHPRKREGAPAGKHEDNADGVPQTLETLAGRATPVLGTELRRIARKVRESSTRDAEYQRRLLEAYSELAAQGQIALGLSTEMQPLLDRIRAGVQRVEKGNGAAPRDGVLSAFLLELDVIVSGLDARMGMFRQVEKAVQRRRRTMDVAAEIDIFRELVRWLIDARGARMHIETPESGTCRVEMRPESFHRLLHILTINAIEWLRAVKTPELRLSVRNLAGQCEVIFADNGPGIPNEMATRVFDPLFSAREGGKGLGLAIARNLVEAHGGRIEVITDRRRRGASIRILLPRKGARTADN